MFVILNLLKKITLSIFIFLLLPAVSAVAAEFSVRPFLVDHVVQPRDVVTDTVLLTNDSEYRKYVVYATVNEIDIDTEGKIKKFVTPVMTDRTNTVTSWIEVTRGRIEIPPGENREVPLTFRINPKAEPGEYHAFIGFVPAKNRPTAEAIAMDGQAHGVVVKLTVSDQREDSMKITSFSINRFITSDDKREVDIKVQNMGDIPSTPKGEIIFYDSRGEEISSAPVNTDDVLIKPGETATIKSTVPVEDTLGRFKANVSLKYGQHQQAALYDTTYFYMMPLPLLLLLFGVILIGALIVTLLFRRAFFHANYDDEDGEEVMMYVRKGHNPKPQDHDIDLSNKTE